MQSSPLATIGIFSLVVFFVEMSSHHVTSSPFQKRVLKAKAAMVFKPNPALDQRFEHFKVQYNKNYAGDAEELKRRALWESNHEMIEQHNRQYKEGKQTYTLGEYEFSDWTPEEFSQRMLGAIPALPGGNSKRLRSHKHYHQGNPTQYGNVYQQQAPTNWHNSGTGTQTYWSSYNSYYYQSYYHSYLNSLSYGGRSF